MGGGGTRGRSLGAAGVSSVAYISELLHRRTHFNGLLGALSTYSKAGVTGDGSTHTVALIKPNSVIFCAAVKCFFYQHCVFQDATLLLLENRARVGASISV